MGKLLKNVLAQLKKFPVSVLGMTEKREKKVFF
jgi:hypothetical protein